ncbi:aminotransferase class V-fold PLP-dependent enzyme [Aliiglaciecola sp. LCG003]|uniref:pyridoxal phosphate-dependent decarboxylase family protein n=1 Tax=Aliiglaciecola sp. LCG003 TaxID=3053655 RepID=UPI00257244DC|nr:aminotransferase class V-fold PLP-dependent enzyme [Aliiglaciecola sp. LCG003]WJG08061.1 aminotransferase class V-fold PLP-dependent enzyme [Aliiglaciecola sp. LCG003]
MSKLQADLFSQQDNQELLKQAADFAYSYTKNLPKMRSFPNQQSLSLLKELNIPLPEASEDPAKILGQLNHIGAQNTVPYSVGRYFGFVNGGALPIGLAAKWMADVWDQNAGLYVMSPIAAQTESVCQRWLTELFSLPHGSVAGLVGGTSVATLCGLAAARYRQLSKLNWDLTERGLFGAPSLRIIVGTQTHGTVIKMLNLLGFGRQQLEWVECDKQGRMKVDQLPELDQSCILILQAGNVCSGAFDNFSQLIPQANEAGCWVHVDGAFGLWASASKQFDSLTQGVELANSWSVDGHKTLNTPYDCGIILCSDQDALTHALHQQGSYIQASDERDNMNFTPDMSRRARGIELWACMRYLGRKGIAQLVELLHQRAVYIASQLAKNGFKVVNDVVFNQVIIQCENDEITQATLKALQRSGELWCVGAKWQERSIIRISICSWATTVDDIDCSVATFIKAHRCALSI